MFESCTVRREHGIVPHRYRKPLVWRMSRCGRALLACARADGRDIMLL